MISNVIHFGSGALGLGLVVPEFFKCSDFDVFLANRSSDGSNEKNELLKDKKHYLLRKVIGFDSVIRVKNFIFYSEIEKFKSLLSQDRPIFITTALKETGIRDTINLFSEIIHWRNSSGINQPLVFIACENAITSTSIKKDILANLKVSHGENYTLDNNIVFLDAVVDCICNLPSVEQNKSVLVKTEEYRSWIIDSTPIEAMKVSKFKRFIIETLNSLEHVNLVEDLQFYVNRKKWLVNSMHQIIALYSHEAKKRFISDFLESDSGSVILNLVGEEILDIYLLNEPDANEFEAKKFIENIKDRLESHASETDAALSRFKRDKLPEFFTDFSRKVGYPTIKFLEETGQPLFYIPLILLKVTAMITEENYVLKKA